ncbi:hypothetical protein ACIG53_20430 [Streptomyces bauhiniae]|uniref:hypothetical protein n=1 Tax=Streptomyces bauhiniae TaxID=2340725 RepID=UPI0037D3E648
MSKYEIKANDYYLIDKAKVILVNRCMRVFGSSYAVPAPAKPVAQASRRYGVTEHETAAAYGYHMPKVKRSTSKSSRNLTKKNELLLFGGRGGRPEWAKRVPKVPPGGCSGEADAKISGGATPYPVIALARGIDSGSFVRAMKNPRWIKANESWSSCMAKDGHRYASPLEAIADAKFQEVDNPTAQEKKVAVRDVQCKRESHLIEVWRKIESVDQEAKISRHAAELQRLKSFQEAEVQRAHQVLADLN